MTSGKKLKRQAVSASYIKETAADFMRWCRERDTLKKQAAVEEAITLANKAISRALMVWADDGGAAA